MKMRLFLSAVTIVLLSLPAFADIEELDLYAWQTNQPLPRAWTASTSMLRKSDTWKGGVYFTSKSGWLQSPPFAANIRSVLLYVATSSSDPSRRLYLHPISNGITNEQGIAVDPTPVQSYEAQEFSFAQYAANQFVLKFDDSGGSGNWGLIYITVRYGTPDPGEKDDGTSGCWSLSSFVPRPGNRTADFSPLGGVIPSVSSNAWRNGQTVRGFHAFSGDNPCTNIRVGTPSSTAGGLYVIVTNDVHGSCRALAVHGTSERKASLLLPIALNADYQLERMSVAYRIWELGKGKASSLSFAYCAIDDLESMDATGLPWDIVGSAAWESGDTNAVRTVEVPVNPFRVAKYACLRWQVPMQKDSPIIGISDVRVSVAVRPRGFAVLIR